MIAALALDQNELDALEHIIVQMEGESGSDRLSALADMRFTFIEEVCSASVVKPHESREHMRSVAVDRILTGRYTAIPVFILIMLAVFWLTFDLIGQRLSDLLELGIESFTGVVDAWLTDFGVNPVVHSLVIDGIFAGVGSVLSFLPIIVVLFLLPLHSRGLRLHGPRRLRDGQAAAQNRPFRPQHRADADRLRLQRAGDHGDPNASVRP